MLIDMHVHTSRYSACGKSTPDEMVAQAELVGLNALVFTEHHVIWPQDELLELQARHPRIKLFTGIEIETREGEDLLVYEAAEDSRFYRRMPAGEAAEAAHACGGFVTLAHPFRYRPTIAPGFEQFIDGIEVLSIHILNYGRDLAQEYADSHTIIPLAASDAHNVQALGLYAMEIAQDVAVMAELIAALRQRRYSLYSDQERIRNSNNLVCQEYPEVLHRIELGEDDGAIARQVPDFTGHMVSSVRNHLDYQHPLR